MDDKPQEHPETQREYEPPEIEVVGTVREATLMGFEGLNADGIQISGT